MNRNLFSEMNSSSPLTSSAARPNEILAIRVTDISLLSWEQEDAFNVTATKLVRGEEALSALYSYEVEVEDKNDACRSGDAWLGKRVVLSLTAQTMPQTLLRRIYGIVTSVESGVSKRENNQRRRWYKLTIGPELTAACFSCNHSVYHSHPADDTETPAVAEGEPTPTEYRAQVFVDIASRWGTPCEVSPQAQKRIPDYVQLLQNDESDYNFLCRLLSAWGLGYCWKMVPDTRKNTEGQEEADWRGKEVLCVYDVLGGEIPSTPVGPLACMYPGEENAPIRRRHIGFHSLSAADIELRRDRGDAPSRSAKQRPKLSIPNVDAALRTTKENQTDRYSHTHFLNRHFNANAVQGTFDYSFAHSSAEGMAPLKDALTHPLGSMVTWAESELQDGSDIRLTKRVVKATPTALSIAFSGRVPEKMVLKPAQKSADGTETEPEESQTVGYGPLPCGMTPVDNPEQEENAPLLKEAGSGTAPLQASYDAAKFFLAKVCAPPKNAEFKGRNLCYVQREGATTQEWVELGSPFADSRSGFFVRPRVGNVLLCVDKETTSDSATYPIAISSLFRDIKATEKQESQKVSDGTDQKIYPNEAPRTKLKIMDRRKREWTAPITDDTALTLRNRTHVPERTYTSTNEKAAAEDRYISDDDLLFVQRPQNVQTLAEEPKPFSQIQMISRDNGVKPIPHNDMFSDCFIGSSVTETVAGLATDAAPPCYSVATSAKGWQTAATNPSTRPHLQGINMYSSQDVLLQSADNQIYNSGGIIELTANHAIRLKVGASSITISEGGIEIKNATGKLKNPGAKAPYFPEDESETGHFAGSTLPLSGAITVDSYGVTCTGPNIANRATNNFTADTFMGSSFRVSDFGATLHAPDINISAGCGMLDLANTVKNKTLPFIDGVAFNDGSNAATYAGHLADGRRTDDCIVTLKDAAGWLSDAAQFAKGIPAMGKKLASLNNLMGSQMKMTGDGITLTGDTTTMKACALDIVDTPLAGFLALFDKLMPDDWTKTFAILDEGFKFGQTFDSLRIHHGRVKNTDADTEADTFSCRFPSLPSPSGTSVTTSVAAIGFETAEVLSGMVLSYVAMEALKELFLSRAKKTGGAEVKEYLANLETEGDNTKAALLKQEQLLDSSSAIANEQAAEINSLEQKISQNAQAVDNQERNVVKEQMNVNNQAQNASEQKQASVQNASNALVQEDDFFHSYF